MLLPGTSRYMACGSGLGITRAPVQPLMPTLDASGESGRRPLHGRHDARGEFLGNAMRGLRYLDHCMLSEPPEAPAPASRAQSPAANALASLAALHAPAAQTGTSRKIPPG